MNSRVFGRRALWAVLILSLIGFGLSVESYREIKRTASGEPTWCSFGSFADCEKAFRSSYSKLWGRPTSLYGSVTYLFLAWIAMLGLKKGGPFALASLFHLGLLSFPLIGVTCYLAWASFIQLKILCPICVAIYLINMAIVGLVWWTCWQIAPPYDSIIRWDIRTLFGDFRRTTWTVLVVALIIALIILLGSMDSVN